jgi:predicted dehydrogenase
MTGALEQPLRGSPARTRRPRLAFLGVGWIGRHRMQAFINSGVGDVLAIADASEDAGGQAAHSAPGVVLASGLEELLDMQPDGLVVATPNACHASQSIQALRRGIPVFCQKPLGRNVNEVASVLDAAKSADRLLGIDFCYRRTHGMTQLRDLIASGAIGEVFAAELTFHNAYGPDKAWFYDRAQSGGGCVMDLGVHLVDLALWALDGPEVSNVTSRLYAAGCLLPPRVEAVEDYAVASILLERGATLSLCCSWNLNAGRDAVIRVDFHGTRGGASFRNVDGSFYDFQAELYEGTRRKVLSSPPDDWGGRTIVAWAEQLATSGAYDPAIESACKVAEVVDAIYGRRSR